MTAEKVEVVISAYDGWEGGGGVASGTLIKKRTKFSHIWGDSDGIGCKVIYEEGPPNIWGNAQIFNHIWGGR